MVITDLGVFRIDKKGGGGMDPDRARRRRLGRRDQGQDRGELPDRAEHDERRCVTPPERAIRTAISRLRAPAGATSALRGGIDPDRVQDGVQVAGSRVTNRLKGGATVAL